VLQNGKILAIDYGSSTIGLAVSDEKQQMAFGRGVIKRKIGFEKVAGFIRELCHKEGVVKIVIGLPMSEEGNETVQTSHIRKFAHKLGSNIRDIPILFFDESFTSFEADRFLASLKVKASKRKQFEDELAAVFILEHFLESQTGEFDDAKL